MEQILINENRNAVADFQGAVNNVVTRSQELIDQFHEFQSWKRITTIEEFYQLLRDPSGYFDEILLANVEIKSTGNLQPNVEVIATMFNIERDDFRNLTSGFPISEGCQGCKKTTVRKGKRSIGLAEFQEYGKYINFNEGTLSVNEDAVNTKKESFRIFATSPEQTELYNYWHGVVDTLNGLHDRGYLSGESLKTLQKSLNNRVMYSYGTNKLHLNEETLLHELLKLKI